MYIEPQKGVIPIALKAWKVLGILVANLPPPQLKCVKKFNGGESERASGTCTKDVRANALIRSVHSCKGAEASPTALLKTWKVVGSLGANLPLLRLQFYQQVFAGRLGRTIWTLHNE
jgi:hypothetical protein